MPSYVFNYRPEISVHERLKNNGVARALKSLAEQKNYAFLLDNGIFRKESAFVFRNGFLPDDQILDPYTALSTLENAPEYSPDFLG